MNIRSFLTFTTFSIFFLSSITRADLPSLSQHATLSQVFHDFRVTDFHKPDIQTFVLNEPGACSPFYYVEIRFPGSFDNQFYQIELDLQTLTSENMERIAKAIQENYAHYGLPECMKSDTYDTEDWITDEQEKILMVPASLKGNHHTCYGDSFEMPYTNCVSVEQLYPPKMEN